MSTKDFQTNSDYDSNSEGLFPLHIPQYFKQRINFADANDPLLQQVMPSVHEHIIKNDDLSDPVGDLLATQVKGLIHKYQGRVLLITTGACAINCRYCFRRNFPYVEQHASSNNWQAAINYINNSPDIHEVILSGGDPLMLSIKVLKKLTTQLEKIKHIKTLRIHTRIPLVSPKRITQNFLGWLDQISLKKVMVLHCNHTNELGNDLKNTLQSIAKCNTLLLNQSVLLKNVNDDSKVLSQLSHQLFTLGILPYYLNQLDKAKGISHFRVSNTRAKNIHKQLMQKLPGYLVPKLVVEISGKKNKTPLI